MTLAIALCSWHCNEHKQEQQQHRAKNKTPFTFPKAPEAHPASQSSMHIFPPRVQRPEKTK